MEGSGLALKAPGAFGNFGKRSCLKRGSAFPQWFAELETKLDSSPIPPLYQMGVSQNERTPFWCGFRRNQTESKFEKHPETWWLPAMHSAFELFSWLSG